MSRHRRAHRISILTTGLAIGGAEAQVALLAKGLKRRGWNVWVSSMLPPQAHREELEASGVPVQCLEMQRGIPDLRAVFRLARHWRSFRPHVVHAHMVHANLLGRITRIVAPAPVLISTAHSIYEGPRWRDWAYRLTDRLSDLTSNVSMAGLQRYVSEKLASEASSVWVPNGIDVKHFVREAGLKERKRLEMGWGGEFVWIAVGNLREPKDYPNLIAAFHLICQRHPQVRMAIAGCGDLEDRLRLQVHQLGISTQVQFLGRRSDIRELLQAADAYVLSSAWEGTSMALLEAAASRLPVAATRVGGNPEVIEDGSTGFLAAPKDYADLSAAMLRVQALSSDARAAMGERGRSRVETIYGQERILDKWENIYEQLFEERVVTARLSRWLLPFRERTDLWRNKH
jgi:glycosyltransferase involved in cell wall biosynthesis